jgi:hypothetical protein
MIAWFTRPHAGAEGGDEQDRLHQLKLHMPIQANSSLVLLKSVLEDQGWPICPPI